MGQRDVGHSVVATGSGVLRLSSSVQQVFFVAKAKRQLQAF
ncbi:hypothetical protein [Lysinibacillus sp. Ag94]|nr:hypothetical protein [Lysinibacillus sp. Ag94]